MGPEQARAAEEFAAHLRKVGTSARRAAKTVALAELALLFAATVLRTLRTMLAGSL